MLYQEIAEIRRQRAHAWHAASSARRHTVAPQLCRSQWRRIALDLDAKLLETLALLPRTDYKFPLVVVIPGVGARFLRKVKRNQAFYTAYDHSVCLDVQWEGTTIEEKLREEADLLEDDETVATIEIAEVRSVESKPWFLAQYGLDDDDEIALPDEDEDLEDYLKRVAS